MKKKKMIRSLSNFSASTLRDAAAESAYYGIER